MQVLDRNLKAAILICKRVARHMLERGQGGKIITVSSVAALKVYDEGAQAMYATAKAGLHHYTKHLGATASACRRGVSRLGLCFRPAQGGGWKMTRVSHRALCCSEPAAGARRDGQLHLPGRRDHRKRAVLPQLGGGEAGVPGGAAATARRRQSGEAGDGG